MQILDNINQTVRSDLQASIKKRSKVSIAAACFSIYAYQELKKQLDSIDELRFIFTSPTFIQEKIPKEKREFYPIGRGNPPVADIQYPQAEPGAQPVWN